jgi:hypothetical protein
LKDSVPVVFKVEQVFIGFVFGEGICEPFSGEEADIVLLVF